MSFSYNPYNHIEVLHKTDDSYRLHCHSCGGEFGDFKSTVPVYVLFERMGEHVNKSHGRTRKDFESWPDT